MPRAEIKAVVWPRDPKDVKKDKVHRYVIIGMILSDVPIDGLEGENEVVIEGNCDGMIEILREIKKRKANRVIGDAVDAMLSLGDV